MRNILLAGALVLAPLAAANATVLPDPVFTDQTLHGFCGSAPGTVPGCTDDGTITPDVTNSPLGSFGFNRSPPSNNGLTNPLFSLIFLVPEGAATQNISASSIQLNGGNPVTESLVTRGVFTGAQDLAAYLGVARIGGDNNPANAFLSAETDQNITGVTGFDVYRGNFGPVSFANGATVQFTSDSTVPLGTIILGIVTEATCTAKVRGTPTLFTDCIQDSTANSAALIVTKDPPTNAPEPMSIALLGTGLVGVGAVRRWVR